MTQLEQLRVILAKEIKTKQMLAKQETNAPRTTYYYSGALAALNYVKYVIDKMLHHDGDQ